MLSLCRRGTTSKPNWRRASPISMLLYIHLKLFCLQHQHASDMAHRLSEMSFIIDDSHSAGHTGAYCKEHCLPSLEVNSALLGTFPTSIAESVNSQFSLLGHTVHHMNKFFAQLFIHERAKTQHVKAPAPVGQRTGPRKEVQKRSGCITGRLMSFTTD